MQEGRVVEKRHRDHIMERVWILSHRHQGPIIDFEIKERRKI